MAKKTKAKRFAGDFPADYDGVDLSPVQPQGDSSANIVQKDYTDLATARADAAELQAKAFSLREIAAQLDGQVRLTKTQLDFAREPDRPGLKDILTAKSAQLVDIQRQLKTAERAYDRAARAVNSLSVHDVTAPAGTPPAA